MGSASIVPNVGVKADQHLDTLLSRRGSIYTSSCPGRPETVAVRDLLGHPLGTYGTCAYIVFDLTRLASIVEARRELKELNNSTNYYSSEKV
jgi:hypothetical protein